MQLAMIGLGRMGANIVRRLMRDGHECVVYDVNPESVSALVAEGATGADSVADLAAKLQGPRVVWLMVPASLTGRVVDDVAAVLDEGDIIIDGGNSNYRDDVRRAAALRERGIDGLGHHPAGEPAEVICDYARQHGCDLIVIGHRHLSRMERLLDRSVGQWTVDHAPCPVLVEVRGGEA